MKTLLVFRTECLPATQTFVLSQASSLQRYRPAFCGLGPSRMNLAIPFPSVLLTQTKKERRDVLFRRFYAATGYAPSFHRALEQIRPDLLHIHFAEDSGVALPLVRILRIPTIVTLHGSIETLSNMALARRTLTLPYLLRRREMWMRTSIFLCVSESVKKTALRAGYPPEKLRVHYTGVDLDLFRPDIQKRDHNAILFVGRLAERKGCRQLLEAFRTVQSERPSAALYIIGDGPERLNLERHAVLLGLRAQFLGHRSVEEIRDWMRRAWIFCAPSVSAHDGIIEGLGMVFAEAQSVGLPVVSYHHGGIPEVVLHPETGLLAPEGDTKILAKYLLHYFDDPDAWQKASASGIEWMSRRFDLQKQTRQLEDIYDQLLLE